MTSKMIKWPADGASIPPGTRADIKLRNGNVLQNLNVSDVLDWNRAPPEGEAKLDVVKYAPHEEI